MSIAVSQSIEGESMFTKQIIHLSLPIAAVCAFSRFNMGIQNHPRSAS